MLSSALSCGSINLGEPPASRECRVYERGFCDMPTSCHPASLLGAKEMHWDGTICDLSQGGVGVLLERRFEKGSALALEMPGDGHREPSVVFVKVVHVQHQGNGHWVLGCRFVSDLSAEEVQRLMASKRYVLSPKDDKDL